MQNDSKRPTKKTFNVLPKVLSAKYEVFKRVGTLQSAQLTIFAFSGQLCRLWSVHSFEDFNLAEQHLWQHIVSLLCSSEGPNRCSNVGDSLFSDGEPLSSVYSSLFMWFTNPPEAQTVYKCAKYFKPNSANRIQGLEENPSNNVIQIMHI